MSGLYYNELTRLRAEVADLAHALREMTDDRDSWREQESARAAEAVQFLQERDALRADAERYRFIDEHAGVVDMIADPDNLVQVWVGDRRYYGQTLDAAIDAAMAAQGASK